MLICYQPLLNNKSNEISILRDLSVSALLIFIKNAEAPCTIGVFLQINPKQG